MPTPTQPHQPTVPIQASPVQASPVQASSAVAEQPLVNLTRVNPSLGISVVVLPVLLGLSAIFYQRHHARVLRQKIEVLERSWKLNYRTPSS